jgi:hypothetical protein
VIGLLGASPAFADPRDMATLYFIQAGAVPSGEREIASRDYVIKQRLLPSGLAELVEPTTLKSGVSLPAGTQLLEVQTASAVVYCAERTVFSFVGSAQICLIDSDHDGRFESWFTARSATNGIITISGQFPKRPKLLTSTTAYRAVEPSQFKSDLFVAIQWRDYITLSAVESFLVVFGREGETSALSAPHSVKSAELPREVAVMGSRFTALSKTAGKLRVRVDAAMPHQPFSVNVTTSYTVIPG